MHEGLLQPVRNPYLVADTKLESSRAPVNELNLKDAQRQISICFSLEEKTGTNSSLGLNGSNGSVAVLGNDVSSVKQAAGHVLALSGIAHDHLVGGLEAREGHLRDRVLLVESLWRKGRKNSQHQ